MYSWLGWSTIVRVPAGSGGALSSSTASLAMRSAFASRSIARTNS